jgi:ketosteroid isomerase-like protein
MTHFAIAGVLSPGVLLRISLPPLAVILGTGRVLASLTALAAPATAQVPSDSMAVAAVVDRYHHALAAGDSATALALLSPNAIILESGGVESLREYRSHHLPADIAFARAVKGSRSPVRVTVRGDVDWTSATSTTRGRYRGKTVNSTGAELMVLTRSADGWTISAIHWSARNRSRR